MKAHSETLQAYVGSKEVIGTLAVRTKRLTKQGQSQLHEALGHACTDFDIDPGRTVTSIQAR